MKAEIEGQLASSTTTVFPDQADRVARQAVADASFEHQKREYEKTSRDPDGRKFPGML